MCFEALQDMIQLAALRDKMVNAIINDRVRSLSQFMQIVKLGSSQTALDIEDRVLYVDEDALVDISSAHCSGEIIAAITEPEHRIVTYSEKLQCCRVGIAFGKKKKPIGLRVKSLDGTQSIVIDCRKPQWKIIEEVLGI